MLVQNAGGTALPYFALVAHGFELAFKAVLIRRGWDEDRLMLIGHDISCCRDAVQSTGDELIDTDMATVVDALSSPMRCSASATPRRGSKISQTAHLPSRAWRNF